MDKVTIDNEKIESLFNEEKDLLRTPVSGNI